ncbi:MAG: tetratricopeptide repeat protein [Fervidobacterium sp.]|uniref:Tetratricopeptide repeat-containing protein n=1 Tax=Fervidobacterium gondwanense DSM 13020 TaxID=1121883 RepID=A0A1M7S6E9_FERGO|nr:tetratricopeptide repeat protein [Fervidobacterium gondwanense]UXF00868.1 hypothetical protein IB67_04695 [Fervidobacterium riparium]SHN54020.1 hypothetical protein SAMN02745226_00553 [Fervidobacterium gondwanense DSM 13020]
MKQNLSDCQKSTKVDIFLKSLFVAIILLSSLVFPLTLDEIAEKSKTDPEFAWDMYLVYVSRLGSSISKDEEEKIERIGRLVNAKRKLKDYEFAVKEDLSQLVEFSKNFEILKSSQYYIVEIFGTERIVNYISENISKDLSVIILLKFLPETEHFFEKFTREIIQILLEDQKAREYFVKNILKKLDIADAGSKLLKHLYKQYSESDENQRVKLLELYRYFSNDGYKLQEMEELFLKEEEKNKISWHKRISIWFAEHLKKLGSIKLSSYVQKLIITVLIILPITIVFAFRYPRYVLFRTFGLKKRAANIYKKIVEKDPFNPDKRLKLAQLFEEAGMYEEAFNEYNFLKRIKIE